ncbi:hypothetical protein V417_gp07 [Pseudomonas phage MPK6]|uniref:Uncharacterized protein gp6 n=2 Tax=Phikmvvirus TaxID=477967 RepID=A9J763_9CAUD|nr:hypothetical protein PPLUZ19_gp6 [Pseudomonas phage LUZ19]YP_008766773.1 hypothetical protein V417_gp07 [Pseudomonas phage MPK6]AFX93673.1 hypothetical protein MPK6_06 [Pseudomonas phage MPK6]CAP45476.1 hypothetical protein [Pseudomonas phage LUZ19]
MTLVATVVDSAHNLEVDDLTAGNLYAASSPSGNMFIVVVGNHNGRRLPVVLSSTDTRTIGDVISNTGFRYSEIAGFSVNLAQGDYD